MLDLANRPKLGPFILTRELEPCAAFGSGAMPGRLSGTSFGAAPIPQRFLALHSDDHSSHVAYRFPLVRSNAEERRFHAAAEGTALVRHAHILHIEQSGIDAVGHPWVITPYTGDVDGLRTLSRLLREKGGQMETLEVERAMDQLLRALASAHNLRVENGSDGAPPLPTPLAPSPTPSVILHGSIGIDEVLVDRHGAVTIELYGLARAMRGQARSNPELVRDEVRSIVELGYQLITGLRAEEPVIPAGRLVPRLGRAWETWLSRGLDATRGFDSAMQALMSLPSHGILNGHTGPQVGGGVRAVLGRLRASREA